MGGVLVRARHELRANAPAILGFIVLLGLLGGVVLATAAGARRTATAYDRFLAEARAEDVLLGGFGAGTPEEDEFVARIAQDPLVDQVTTAAVMGLVPPRRGGHFVDPIAPVEEGDLFETIVRPNLLAGERPDPAMPDEAMINPAGAEEYGVGVGDRLTLTATTEEDFYRHPGADPETYGDPRTLVITGIAVLPQHIVPLSPSDSLPQLFLTPAYADAHPDEVFSYSDNWVRLRRGDADRAAFVDHLTGFIEDMGYANGYLPVVYGAERREAVNRAIRPQAQALGAFAVLLTLVAIAVVGQLLARHLSVDRSDRERLWALGLTRRELFAVGVGRIAVIALGGFVLAVAVAVALSSRFPIGAARDAETNPGPAVHLGIFVVGSLVLFGGLVLVAGASLWRSLPSAAARRATITRDRRRLGGWLSSAGVPSPAVIGIQTAVERGDGTRALPTAGALASAAIAVAALTSALTFGANLDRLVATPELYGWAWDASVGTGFAGLPLAASRRALARSDVEEFSGINFGRLELTAGDDPPLDVAAIGLDRVQGDVFPRLVRGRPATSTDEIVLGARTAERLGVELGDRIEVRSFTRALVRPATVVGLTVLPGLGAGVFATTDLGDGAVVPASELADPSLGSRYTGYLVRFSPRVGERVDDAADDLGAAFEPIDGNCVQPECAVTDAKPPGIRNYDGMRRTPLLLASVLAALAVVTLAVNLSGAVRRRRGDIAVLRSLGFVRRQVAAIWSWHATAVAVVAVVVGVPVGFVVGRELWTLFADAAGAYVSPMTPSVVLLVVPATVLVANILALVPGRLAARPEPGRALRSE